MKTNSERDRRTETFISPNVMVTRKKQVLNCDKYVKFLHSADVILIKDGGEQYFNVVKATAKYFV